MPLQKRLDPQPPELKLPWRTGARILSTAVWGSAFLNTALSPKNSRTLGFRSAASLARGQGLGTQTIDDVRRLELLRRSAQGKWIGAIALTEPTAGSDLAAVQTRAI